VLKEPLSQRIWRTAKSFVVAALVETIKAEARARRQASGIKPLGPATILAQDPLSRPRKSKRSSAPRAHAVSKLVRKAMYEAYAWFVAAFREAAANLRAGDRMAKLPQGSFPRTRPWAGPSSVAQRRRRRRSPCCQSLSPFYRMCGHAESRRYLMTRLSRLVLVVVAVILTCAVLSPRQGFASFPTTAWVPEDCCTYVGSPGTFERLYVFQNGTWVPTESTRCDPGLCSA
jgi:hypothetical protein